MKTKPLSFALLLISIGFGCAKTGIHHNVHDEHDVLALRAFVHDALRRIVAVANRRARLVRRGE